MKKQTVLTWVIALMMSALAWGDTVKHAEFMTNDEIRKALEDVRGLEKKQERPVGKSKAAEMLDKLHEWNLKVTNEETLREITNAAGAPLDALSGPDLLVEFAKNAKEVLADLDALTAKSLKLAELNKKAFDVQADGAIKAERLYLTKVRKDLLEIFKTNKDLLNDRAHKYLLAQLILRLNEDRILIGYGKEMLEMSRKPKFNKPEERATNRFIALARLQQTELKDNRILKSLVSHVGGKELYPATHQTSLRLQALQTIFSVKENQADADTLQLGQEIIFDRHIPYVLDTYLKQTLGAQNGNQK